MARNGWRRGLSAAALTLAATAALSTFATAQGVRPSPQAPTMPTTSVDQLLRLSPPELDALYLQAAPGPIPAGRVKGRTIPYPGTRLAVPASKVSKVIWQGKVFDPERSMAVNKFFGVRFIKGNVGYGESWLDGRPSIILDYSQTSHLYANYRDEIRQVGPGLYLGLMYARTTPQPSLKLYFVLQTCE